MLNFLSWNGWSKVASLLTAVAAIAALWFSGQSLRATRYQYGLSEQGQVTDRFTKAIENLGSDKVDVRIGGIYSLERLARDSTPDRPAIMDVLGAYIRDHAPAPPLPPDEVGPPTPEMRQWRAAHCPVDDNAAAPVDIQAIITVINRRDPAIPDLRPLDLSHSCLTRIKVPGIQLREADLVGTDMSYADFLNLEGFGPKHNVKISDLSFAHLDYANLSNVITFAVHFTAASMFGADLNHAGLTRADLDKARLEGADLTGADLTGADLSQADLSRAYLRGADLTDAQLTGAHLRGITYDSSTKWPAGFTPPPTSGP